MAKKERLHSTILPILKCIICNRSQFRIESDETVLRCTSCDQQYQIYNDIPLMTLQPQLAVSYSPSVMVENQLTEQWTSIIDKSAPELVLDFGSGNNPNEYPNLIKMDVFAFSNVDVVGLGERVPFVDQSFKAVISGAVFEHVENPFACSRQIYDILKENGEAYIETAFLQPFHAYPNQYFNMTTSGLRKVMASFTEVSAGVLTHQYPPFTLRWILQVWSQKLSGREKDDFLNATIGDVLQEYTSNVFSTRWISSFSAKDREELACAVYFHGRKRPGAYSTDTGTDDLSVFRSELQRLYDLSVRQQSQIQELELHLQKVANGRVMRLMNRFKGLLPNSAR